MTIRSYQAVSYTLTFPVVLLDPALAAEQGSAAAAAAAADGTVQNTAGHMVHHMFDLYFACFLPTAAMLKSGGHLSTTSHHPVTK